MIRHIDLTLSDVIDLVEADVEVLEVFGASQDVLGQQGHSVMRQVKLF